MTPYEEYKQKYDNHLKYRDKIKVGDKVKCVFEYDATLTKDRWYTLVCMDEVDYGDDRMEYFYTVQDDENLLVDKFAWKFEYIPFQEVVLEEELFEL